LWFTPYTKLASAPDHGEVAPRQRLGVALRQHPQRVVPDADPRLGRPHGLRQLAEHRVVLEQVSHLLERTEVVDGDEVDVRLAFLGGAEEVPADPAETVDANTHGHQRGVLPEAG
jgi:hypothetical protein